MTQTQAVHRINPRVKLYHPNDFMLDPLRNLDGIEETEPFRELVSSMEGRREAGLEPIYVACTFFTNSDGQKVLVAGHRRVLAARAVECEVPAYEVAEPNALSRYADALISNEQREDLDPISKAEAYAKMINEIEGMNARKIADLVGKSESLVSQYLALLKLTPPIREAVQDGRLSAKAGYNASRIPEDDQVEHAEAIIARKTAGGIRVEATTIRRMHEMAQPVQQADDTGSEEIAPEPVPDEELRRCLLLLAEAKNLVKQAIDMANEYSLAVDGEMSEVLEMAQSYFGETGEEVEDE